MEVKIYREVENENLILNESQLSEYNELALELGFTTVEKKEANKTPNVYLILNQAMQRQLKAVCSAEIEAEKYTRSTIPLEVLKVYKFAKDNEMFDGFTIWFNDTEPDPMLIGWKWASETAREKQYSWQVNRYLIARWGDAALEIDELLKLGFNNLKVQIASKAMIALEKCNAVIKNPELYVNKILNNDAADMKIDLDTSGSNLFF